ncbi:MAG: toxin-antitoxin system YwqK family antitoxin [Victivallaceae bacterium]|nr:hypothetical protein [Victivallaceae bacterium]
MNRIFFTALLSAAACLAAAAGAPDGGTVAAKDLCVCEKPEIAAGSAKQTGETAFVIADGPAQKVMCYGAVSEGFVFDGYKLPDGDYPVEWNGRKYTVHHGPKAYHQHSVGWWCGNPSGEHPGVREYHMQTTLVVPVMEGTCSRCGKTCKFLNREGRLKVEPVCVTITSCRPGEKNRLASNMVSGIEKSEPETPAELGEAVFISPPSQYVGIGNYSSLSYGDPPPENSTYTGYWRGFHDDSRIMSIEGNYKDGIPIGTWREYYENGNVKTVIIYDGAGRYEETGYYPDGSLEVFSRGTYEFSGGEAPRHPGFNSRSICFIGPLKIGWELDGVKGRAEISSGKGFDRRHNCYIFTYCSVLENNGLEADVHVMENKYLGRVEKFTVSGRINPETGTLEDAKVKTVLGGSPSISDSYVGIADDNGVPRRVDPADEAVRNSGRNKQFMILVKVPRPDGTPFVEFLSWRIAYHNPAPQGDAGTKK